MTITDHEVELITSMGLHRNKALLKDVELRGDRPQEKVRLIRVQEAKAEAQSQLDALLDEETQLLLQLLPDEHRARMAQLARDLRDGPTEPRYGDPLTPCPPWCSKLEHAETQMASWHEGAPCAVNLASGESTLYCEVVEGQDAGRDPYGPCISISAEAGEITPAEAREFANGLLRAADVLEQATAVS